MKAEITSLPNLTTNGFLKTGSSNGTISVDTSTYAPTSRTLTINSTTYDLSADRSWTIAWLTWASSISGTSGTGLTLTVDNSASASTVAQSIVIGNTQAQTATGLSISTWTSAQAHTGLLITSAWASANQKGLSVAMSTTGTGAGIYVAGWADGAYHVKTLNSWTGNVCNVLQASQTSSALVESAWNPFLYVSSYREHKHTSGSKTDNYASLYVDRYDTQNGAGGTLVAQWQVAKLESVSTQTAWTLTCTTDVLNLTQSATRTTGKLLTGVVGSTERFKAHPLVADGASAIAYLLDTTTSLSNAGAKLLSIKNAGTEKAYFSTAGELCNDATNKWTFGGRTAATVALDTTQYLTVTIGGTAYKVWIVA